MFYTKKLEQITCQIKDYLSKGLRELGEDINKKLQTTLQSQIDKLDLISREEFNNQTQTLLKISEKIIEIEKRIEQFEKNNHSIKKNK
ncbi:MAG: accessory factor UbiK family protein [Arsenophonus sp. ER-BJ3-MAG3]